MRTRTPAGRLGLMGAGALALGMSLACSTGPRLPEHPEGELALEVAGKVKGGPFRLGAAQLAALSQRKLRGADPAGGREETYTGVDLAALEDRIELSPAVDTLVVRAADRRSVAIPLSVVRQLRPVLALQAEGVQLQATQLAWPNVAHFGIGTDPRAPLWWLTRVVRLEYVAWADVYGKAMRLPPGAPAGALAGARTFGTRCIGCHGMRGAGGASAPDLSRGGAWTRVEPLRAVLAGHPGWTGPGLVQPPDERIPEVASFLWTLAALRDLPQDDEGANEEDAEPAPLPPRVLEP